MSTERQQAAQDIQASLDKGDVPAAFGKFQDACKKDPKLAGDVATFFKEQRR